MDAGGICRQPAGGGRIGIRDAMKPSGMIIGAIPAALAGIAPRSVYNRISNQFN